MALHDITVKVAGKPRVFESYTRSRAIKEFCRDCMNGVMAEVRNCTAPECPLFHFRPYQVVRSRKE